GGVADAVVDLDTFLEHVREDQQVQQRREDRRADRLEAHLVEAQQLLAEQRVEALPGEARRRARRTARRLVADLLLGRVVLHQRVSFISCTNTSSRSVRCSSISSIVQPASRRPASTVSTSW